jgi:4-amino-4-deoxy-L-arabinose transferase-like glycosyltransferase
MRYPIDARHLNAQARRRNAAFPGHHRIQGLRYNSARTWWDGSLGNAPLAAVIASDSLVWLFACVAFFVGLGAAPLSDNNEGLYASIAAQMLKSGHFVIPQLAGLPYIEKPPLLYWLIVASFAVFGETAWAARLVPSLAALGTCVVLFAYFSRLGLRREARVAVIVFSGSLGVVSLAHLVLFDMLLVFGLTAALTSLSVWVISSGRSTAALRWAAVGLAVAILAKGLVGGVLVMLILGVSLILESRPRRPWLVQAADPAAATILAALVLPWHLLAAWQQEGFTWFYLINEHFLRFLGTREPEDFHRGPWYFYVPRLVLAMLPWVWLAPALLQVRPDPARLRVERHLLVWAALPFIFFSVSQAKADYYIIVCLPPLAAWVACRLGRLQESAWRALPKYAVAAAAVNFLTVVAFHLMAGHRQARLGLTVSLLQDRHLLAGTLAVCFVVAPLLAARMFRARRSLTALLLFATPMLSLLTGIAAIAGDAAASYSSEPLARLARSSCGSTPLFVYGAPEAVSAVLFYWRDPFRIVDSQSADFDFALRHSTSARKILIDSQSISLPRSPAPPLCVIVPASQLARFQRSALATGLVPVAQTSNAALWVGGDLAAKEVAP